MKNKRNKIILLLSAMLLVGILVIHLFRTREPAYQGKTLTEWTEQFRDVVHPLNFDPHSEKLSTSQQAIQAIGSDAVPFYVKWIQAKDSPLQVKLCNLLESQSLIKFHFRTAEDKHDMAQYGFIALGHDTGKTAIPELLRLAESHDNELQHRVLGPLQNLRPDKIEFMPALLKLLNSPDTQIKQDAAEAIKYLYPEEAKKAGVYKIFPQSKPSATNALKTIAPEAASSHL